MICSSIKSKNTMYKDFHIVQVIFFQFQSTVCVLCANNNHRFWPIFILCIHYFYLEMGLFAQFNANHENLQHESSVRRSKLQLQSQQQNVKTSNTPVTVIDVKTRNMPPEICNSICFENKQVVLTKLLFSIEGHPFQPFYFTKKSYRIRLSTKLGDGGQKISKSCLRRKWIYVLLIS